MRENPADLAAIPIVLPAAGAGGGPTVVPLGQVATITASGGPAQIDHLDRSRVITVGANIEGSIGNVTQAAQQRLARLRLPEGYTVTAGGQSKDQAEVFGSIFTALGVAVMLMYLILVIQFGSFLDPLAILMSLPLSLIGVLLALAITGNTINIMSLIGVILLMGIVAKNAILLIDFAKWAREKEGMPLREALIEAGAIRLRPILMTTFALIAGSAECIWYGPIVSETTLEGTQGIRRRRISQHGSRLKERRKESQPLRKMGAILSHDVTIVRGSP
jgi:HAE1 family hydrophobic/amphiphilic exporter-1